MLRLFVGIEFPPELKLRLSLLETTLPGSELVLDAEERAALDEVWFHLPRPRPAAGPVR